MKVKIRIFEPGYDKREFYGIMGDPLTMPQVRKELPYLSNTPDTVWFLAFVGDTLAGFAALAPGKSSVALRNLYVFPEYRGNKISRKLLDAWIKYAGRYALPIVAAVTTAGMQTAYRAYQALGFVETRRTKNYVFLRREP
ncbi:MAG: GNAT family N-acetyltransferase [Minisyncoccales bacterium]